MDLLSLLATILGVITGLANIPQIIKIFKTKSGKDLSISTNIIFLLSSIVWLIYGFELDNYPIIIANIIYVITYILIIVGYLTYNKS